MNCIRIVKPGALDGVAPGLPNPFGVYCAVCTHRAVDEATCFYCRDDPVLNGSAYEEHYAQYPPKRVL